MPAPSQDPRHRSTARLTDLTYWEATQHPTYVILFLAPLLLLQWVLRSRGMAEGEVAHNLVVEDALQQLTRWVGFETAWMPAALMLLSLLVWLSLTPQRVPKRWVYLPMMLAESVLVALPLLVLGLLLSIQSEGIGFRLTLALTAGIYEEFVFRFILTGGLILLFRAALPEPEPLPMVVAIMVSALLFAICHFQPVGERVYSGWALVRLVLAGGYLALVFVGRGLGIAVGAHIAYDLWVLSMRGAHY